jgi:hypothetical protein
VEQLLGERFRGGRIARSHEHHVDVGRIVELARAQLPHRHDRELARLVDRAERRLQTCVGEVGERAADLLQGNLACEIPGGDLDQAQALRAPEVRDAGRACLPHQRRIRVAVRKRTVAAEEILGFVDDL